MQRDVSRYQLQQLLEDSLEERLEKAGGLVPDSEKVDGEAKEGELEENKVINGRFLVVYLVFAFYL